MTIDCVSSMSISVKVLCVDHQLAFSEKEKQRKNRERV